MTLIYPPEYHPRANDVTWDDVAETAWVRIELTDCECVYRPLDVGMLDGQLVIDHMTPEAAAVNDWDCARKAIYTNDAGDDWVWDFSYDVYVRAP